MPSESNQTLKRRRCTLPAAGLAIVDERKPGSLSTPAIGSGTSAFFFNQRGLTGGLRLQRSRITRIQPSR